MTGERPGAEATGGAAAAGAALSVRPAAPRDVPEIARIQLETWRIAYARLLPAAVLAAATPERAQAEWKAAITDPPSPRHRVLVARDHEWTVGFVAFGPAGKPEPPDTAPAGSAPGAHGERGVASRAARVAQVHALLVEPRWGRRGHGSRLLAAAVDHLRADGMTQAQVWLLDGDAASEAFYRSAGWEPDGTARTLEDGEHRLREVRFHVGLDDGVSLEEDA